MRRSGALIITLGISVGFVGVADTPPTFASTPADCATSTDQPNFNNTTERFEISNAQELIYLSQHFTEVVGGDITTTWREQDFSLTASIDLGGCNFTPIGAGGGLEDTSFTGKLDGHSYSITGLTSFDSGKRGLFGSTRGADIRNLRIVDAQVTSTNNAAGAVVGYGTETTISRVSVTGSVTSQSSNAGGLAGGLVTGSSVRYTAVNVDVSHEADKSSFGGLIGVADDTKVEDSFALGSVSGSGKNVGGLLGQVAGGATITNSYAAGEVSGSSGLGGLVGDHNSGTLVVNDSLWDSDTTGQTTSASNKGIAATTAEMTSVTAFETAGWDIDEGWRPFDISGGAIWGICSLVNDGYPFLLWEYSSNPCLVSPSSSTEPTQFLPRAADAAIHLDVGAPHGRAAADNRVLAEGQGLARGEDFALELNPGRQLLASGEASRLGYFSVRVGLPGALTPGTYTLTLNTNDPAGNPLVLTERFGVDASGLFTAPAPSTATSSGSDTTSSEAVTAGETSGDAPEEPAAEADPGTSDATKTSTPAQNGDDNTAQTGNNVTDSSTTSSTGGTSDPIPGWLVITASSILIALVLGGMGIGIYRARQPRDW